MVWNSSTGAIILREVSTYKGCLKILYWRCSDSLFFEVPPLASNALFTMLHPLIKNMLQIICHKLQDSGIGSFDPLITSKFASISKALPPLENHSSSHCIVPIGSMDELYDPLFPSQTQNSIAQR
jgi:hypothetical protein